MSSGSDRAERRRIVKILRGRLRRWCQANGVKGSLSDMKPGWCCEITYADGEGQAGIHFSDNPVEATWGAMEAAEWGIEHKASGMITSDGRITDARYAMQQLAVKVGMKVKLTEPAGPDWTYKPLGSYNPRDFS